MVLTATVGFSIKAILVKEVYRTAPELAAIDVMAWRMGFALPGFLIGALWAARAGARDGTVTGRDWGGLLGLGLLGYYVSSFLDISGLAYISAALERLILFVFPTLVVLFGALFLGESVTRATRWALIATYAGVALAVADQVRFGERHAVLTGAALVACATLTFAVFSALSGPMIRRVGSTRFAAVTMTVAALATGIHHLATRGIHAPVPELRVLGLCLAMALISTVIPAYLVAAGIRRVGAGRAAIIGSAGPIVTIAVDHTALGTRFTPWEGCGAALVIAGVWLAARRGRR